MILSRLDVTKWLTSCSLAGALVFGASLAALAQQPGASTKPAPADPRALPTDTEKWKGDFNGMLKRRQIRIVVPYSRTLFFNDKGRERGIIADNARDFELCINKKYRKQLRNRPITVYLTPTTRNLLLQRVVNGFADIAAGNLTVTDERKKLVDFVAPTDQKRVSELVVTGHKSPPLAGAEELSGKTVHVRKASSYYESLIALNSRLKKEGKRAAKLVLVPDALEDEDTMEMVSAGLLEAIVVDDWKARLWATLLPKIRVNEKAMVRTGGLIGWGFRKRSPKLTAELKGFYNNFMKKHGTLNWRKQHYYKKFKQITNSTGSTEAKRFHHTLKIFEKYGRKYGKVRKEIRL